MGKLLRFLAFMAPLMAGAIAGNFLAAKIWPELKEKSPWFWLATGGAGSLGGMVAMRLLFGRRTSAKSARKTDPVIPEAPADPKTYEEWRKDLDRTVDENAPDYLPLEDFVRKWSDIPRTPKKKPVRGPELPEGDFIRTYEYENIALGMSAQMDVVPDAHPAVPKVSGAPENIIKYVQKEVEKGAVDPFAGLPAGAMEIRVTEAGSCFHRSEAGPVHFYCDAGKIRLDGIEYAVPQGGHLVINLPAGSHFVHVPGIPPESHAAPYAGHVLTCNGHIQRTPRVTP